MSRDDTRMMRVHLNATKQRQPTKKCTHSMYTIYTNSFRDWHWRRVLRQYLSLFFLIESLRYGFTEETNRRTCSSIVTCVTWPISQRGDKQCTLHKMTNFFFFLSVVFIHTMFSKLNSAPPALFGEEQCHIYKRAFAHSCFPLDLEDSMVRLTSTLRTKLTDRFLSETTTVCRENCANTHKLTMTTLYLNVVSAQ